MWIVVALTLVLAVTEAASFAIMADCIRWPGVLVEISVTALVGFLVICYVCLHHFRRAPDQDGSVRIETGLNEFLLLLAGILLVLPGITTDVLGAALLVPAVRRSVIAIVTGNAPGQFKLCVTLTIVLFVMVLSLVDAAGIISLARFAGRQGLLVEVIVTCAFGDLVILYQWIRHVRVSCEGRTVVLSGKLSAFLGVLAGLLLIMPGITTDLLGLLLLVPRVRQNITTLIMERQGVSRVRDQQ